MKTLQHAITSALTEGPIAASELYERLQGQGYKPNAAKTAVSRLVAGGTLHRSKLGFARNDALLSLGPIQGGPDLVAKLVAKDFYGRPSLSNLFKCIRAEHAAVTRADVAKIAALDVGEDPDRLDWNRTDELISGLVEVGLLRPGGGDHWVANKEVLGAAKLGFSRVSVQPTQVTIRERFRQQLAESLHEWLRTNGFVSWDGSVVCGLGIDAANAFGLAFDYLGFSFSGPTSRAKTVTPVLGDVLREGCTLGYARGFVDRVGRVEARRRGRPTAFIFAKSFAPEAHKLLKEEGIWAWTHNQLLGSNTAEAFQKAIQLVESLVQQQDLDPTLFLQVFDGLENFQGLFGNMKGQLFELLVGYVFLKRGYHTRLAWAINEGGKPLDVDLLGTLNSTAVVIECKGLRRTGVVEHSFVRRHFLERAKLAHRLLRNSSAEKITHVEAIVITTGSFDPLSIAELDSGAFGSQGDITLTLWDRQRLIEELRSDGHTELIKVIEQYYG